MPVSSLSFFHSLIQKWFREKVGVPTDVQEKAWPEIASGRHVLVTAPTGCGKTLAAFLWALNQLITHAWPGGNIRVLYVSPLKALNNDVRRNLLKPLAELKEVFSRAGEPFPDISVLTRSGDTPSDERRKMVRNPPEILITTPESLNLLLTSASGREMLRGIQTVILDEIHAVAATKRGTHLITAVDRLVLLSGEFQRIALSATVNPVERVADFAGGYRWLGKGKNSRYEKRPVSIVRSEQTKKFELKVAFPSTLPFEFPSHEGRGDKESVYDGSWWPLLVAAFKKLIAEHRSSLLFANSRRTAEKVTRMLNEGEPQELVYAHHGSLSREIRLAVEQKLKNGELKAIVATSSLELGIDIGSLDQVILIQTPRSVSSAIQRVGRSGHDVGEKSRGVIFPTHGRDFIDAAVMARAILEQDIEEVRPVQAPLDILAQVVLSMTAAEPWNIDELYGFIRASYPYRDLPRRHFDLVLEMMAGRYADTRLRELKARVSLDRMDNTIQAHSEVRYLIYTSGGTIPDRGYFDLRLKEKHTKIGELDEEFVWERSIGETFTLGTQLWRIENITHNDVEVTPVRSAPSIVPFWRAEEQDRDFHLSERIALFLENANSRLDSADFEKDLMRVNAMEKTAAGELIGFLKLQKDATGSSLPHRHHLLIEHIEEGLSQGDLKQVVLHTFWGGRVNRPFALALSQAWEEQERTPLEFIETDDAVLLMLPRTVASGELFGFLSPENVEALLRKKLEQTGFFGARFRENAERALLLPKPSFKRRMPLWLIRLRAKELMAAVRSYEDFPILLETWRTCLSDEFDLENLKRVLEEVREGRIRVTETVTRSPSPFTGNLVWKRTNRYMYEDDTPLATGQSALRPDLIREILFSPHLRPKIPAALIQVLDEKLKRTAAGYPPGSGLELLDWIKERLLVPMPEWKELAAAIRRDYDADAAILLAENRAKIAWVSWPGTSYPLLTAVETLPKALVAFRMLFEDVTVKPVTEDETVESLRGRIRRYLRDVPEPLLPREDYDLGSFLSAWLSFYGPIEKEIVTRLLGIPSERLDEAIIPLLEAQSLIWDQFGEESRKQEICDSENLETLLRMARRYRQPSFQSLPVRQLPLFLALFQGVAQPGETIEDLQQRLEQLFGWPDRATAWEEYLLPARMRQYSSHRLDTLMDSTDLIWFGCGNKRISLAFTDDLELYKQQVHSDHDGDPAELEHLMPDRRGRYSFLDIAEFSHLDTVSAAERLWKQAWKGNVTTDTFRTIRKAAMARFRPESFTADRARQISRRSGFDRWKSSRPMEGHWLRIDKTDGEADVLAAEELAKDRARQLLKRYGILFRDLMANELPPLQWRAVFRSLRLMEFSGEIVSGYFFEGISGPQFASQEAFRLLQDPLPEEAIFWINATDPASLCGSAAGIVPGLPPRISSTYLVYHGSRMVMIAKRQGKVLDILVPADDPRLHDYFNLFKHLLGREFNPVPRISIEMVNNESAIGSAYAEPLKRFGFRTSRTALELWREY